MKLWEKLTKMGLDEFELNGRVLRQSGGTGNEVKATDILTSDMNLFKGTVRSPQISFPSWIIKSYNPADKLQTANLSVLQSLDETYKLKEQHTEESVITYLDEILLEFAEGEEEKESKKENSFGKLQCEVISKKGQQFEIHLDTSGSVSVKSESDSVKKTASNKATQAKVILETKPNNIITDSKRNSIPYKPSREPIHVITVETSRKAVTTGEEKKKLPVMEKIVNSNVERKQMKKKNDLTIELIKPSVRSDGNGKDSNERRLLHKKDITIELSKSNVQSYCNHIESNEKRFSQEKAGNNRRQEENKVEHTDKGETVNKTKVPSVENSHPINVKWKSSSSSVNEIKKTFDLDKKNRHSYIHDPTKTPSGKPKVVLKSRPKSAEFNVKLHKISNQSGNKTELKRTYTEPLKDITEDNERVSAIDDDISKHNTTNTPSFSKTKNNSFLKSDLFSSFNRFFKYSKPRNQKNTNTLDNLPSRTNPPIVIHRSVRGFDSFMLY